MSSNLDGMTVHLLRVGRIIFKEELDSGKITSH